MARKSYQTSFFLLFCYISWEKVWKNVFYLLPLHRFMRIYARV